MEMEKLSFVEELLPPTLAAQETIGRKNAKEILNALKRKEEANGALDQEQRIATTTSKLAFTYCGYNITFSYKFKSYIQYITM